MTRRGMLKKRRRRRKCMRQALGRGIGGLCIERLSGGVRARQAPNQEDVQDAGHDSGMRSC